MNTDSSELIILTQRLLDAIASADWPTYTELCDASLTAFEPEAMGHLVEGLDFHRYYFELATTAEKTAVQSTLVQPHVRLMGDAAVVSYTRLVQKCLPEGPVTRAFQETRVWQKQAGRWRHVHFHRSAES